ncbi:MAG: hypothetical protein IPL61_26205 [Myxococcales bacterium]|nr:hypothetical protein [Myxococcales bacterium]
MAIGDWTLRVTGAVERIDREDVDKSGRAPRYFFTYLIKPSALADVPDGAVVPELVPIRIKDIELDRMIKVAPQVGDRVVMTARASGAKPSSFYMASVEAAPAGLAADPSG